MPPKGEKNYGTKGTRKSAAQHAANFAPAAGAPWPLGRRTGFEPLSPQPSPWLLWKVTSGPSQRDWRNPTVFTCGNSVRKGWRGWGGRRSATAVGAIRHLVSAISAPPRWAGLLSPRVEERYPEVARRCAVWLENAAIRLEPKVLAAAIAKRYGKDRTFSVPILTTLALTGRLGPAERAWRVVPQLPFELAACPHQWFAWLRLPVVSYALPALIALGLVRHHHRPTWNPVLRLLRKLVRQRALRVLHSIQPSSGGFLEATPLTSFVILSLVGAGLADNPVARAGVDFLVRSVRPAGSWPIDTNLATWVTTLSLNALAAAEASWRPISFPWTGAARESSPGCWANSIAPSIHSLMPRREAGLGPTCPGAVPTPMIRPERYSPYNTLTRPGTRSAAGLAGVVWLLDLQNADGGMPTFCRGWGKLPFDRSSPDLTAHALRAWSAWQEHLPDSGVIDRVRQALDQGLGFLQRTQNPDGSWAALWFGNQHARD